MTKKEVEKEMHRLLTVLMSGRREEFKKAKKEIVSLWNHETKAFKSGAPVALEFLPRFDDIKHVANQEAFVSGLGLFFLTLADDHFETLKNFTLKIIQHPHGHVREAMRKTADWLFTSLVSRVDPFIYPAGKELNDKQIAEQLKGREQYINYVREIEELIDKYDIGEGDAEYISEMKPSINKSLQQLWSRLTEGRAYQKILEVTRPIPCEIFMKRKNVEQEIMAMLKEAEGDFSWQDVKDAIFYEENSDDMMKVVAMFDRGQSIDELNKILATVNDAWNYFPHRTLGGLSPAEKLLEYRERQQ